MNTITICRQHTISCGHRVAGHESKCAYFHGHNYTIHIYLTAKTGWLDDLGRVLDFSIMKSLFCEWLETHWDHKFLMWDKDPLFNEASPVMRDSLIGVPFNPTAENMASALLSNIFPRLLDKYAFEQSKKTRADQLAYNAVGSSCWVSRVIVEETPKCSAEAALASAR